MTSGKWHRVYDIEKVDAKTTILRENLMAPDNGHQCRNVILLIYLPNNLVITSVPIIQSKSVPGFRDLTGICTIEVNNCSLNFLLIVREEITDPIWRKCIAGIIEGERGETPVGIGWDIGQRGKRNWAPWG
jgi:hypothetical protein